MVNLNTAKVISPVTRTKLSKGKSQVPRIEHKRHPRKVKREMSRALKDDAALTKNKNHHANAQKHSSLAPRGRIPWNKGIPLSEETKSKMSEAHMGKPPTFKGRKHSSESRLKQSLSHMGKHPSGQTRRKISRSVKLYFAKRRAAKKITDV